MHSAVQVPIIGTMNATSFNPIVVARDLQAASMGQTREAKAMTTRALALCLFVLGALGAGAGARAGGGAQVAVVDEDGCWSASEECIEADSQWRGIWFVTYYRNVCDERIDVTFCHEHIRRLENPHCGFSGLLPGQTQSLSSRDTTGRYAMLLSGSVNPDADLRCHEKYLGTLSPSKLDGFTCHGGAVPCIERR